MLNIRQPSTQQSNHPRGNRWVRRLRLVVHWALTKQLHIQLGYWVQARMEHRRSRSIKVQRPVLLAAPNPRDLTIRQASQPTVSVIIPTYDNVDITLSCLASIAEKSSGIGPEIIVVDDASPGQAARILGSVSNVKLIVNKTNQGFIGSCNAGARAAKGEFLLFLNNDTQVTDGWLEPMIRLFRKFPHVGAVGSKLIFPDGFLQEAGCIIWRDGTGWNLGRGGDPAAAAYNYVREVDYCSGASLMVPRTLFEQLGGFDERYSPAYFEDVDLSFRLRAMGYRTMYQPRSVVVHLEGASHGKDGDGGAKSHYIARNRTIFVDRWRSALRCDQFANGQNFFRARDRAQHRSLILVVDHLVPEPDRDAGSRTMLSFLKAFLACGFIVKFLPQDLRRTPGYSQALEDLGIEVICAPGIRHIDDWLTEYGAELDAVLLSRPHVAEALLPLLRRRNVGPYNYTYGHDASIFSALLGKQMPCEVVRLWIAKGGIWRLGNAPFGAMLILCSTRLMKRFTLSDSLNRRWPRILSVLTRSAPLLRHAPRPPMVVSFLLRALDIHRMKMRPYGSCRRYCRW